MMGIDASGVAFLLAARASGVDFSTTATLGRQAFIPSRRTLQPVMDAFSLPRNAGALIDQCKGSGDAFLGSLGARSVTSFDASDYEDATVTHDMNQPLPPEHRARYSAVFDGGVMEHVFDAKQFYANALDMVAEGGHYLVITCANNMLGHGFHQFGPEFFYQSLVPENGFEDTIVFLCEHDAVPPAFYSVTPPRLLGRRVELVNKRQLFIMAISKRVSVRPLFVVSPQQSDYVEAWQRAVSSPTPPDGPWHQNGGQTFKRIANEHLPSSVRRFGKRALARGAEGGLRQRRCYRRLSLKEMAIGHLGLPKKTATDLGRSGPGRSLRRAGDERQDDPSS